MRFTITTLILSIVFLESHALTVDHLRVESQINPAIDSTPHFSWQLHSEKSDCMQKSYQIMVYDDVNKTNMVFDTGIVESSESHNVKANISLLANTRYYWVVRVIDNKNEEAESQDLAYFDAGLVNTGWDGAQWIMYPELGKKSTGMPRFRKVISINKPIKKAYLYSSALGIYDLKINGERVGHLLPEGNVVYDELKPGWTDFRKEIYYNVHEISSYLKEGSNVLGADVTNGWWNGGISWGLYGDYPLGFIAKVVIVCEDGSQEVVVTDNSWRVTLDGSYKMGDIYNGEIYDAQLENDWQEPDYNDEGWSTAVRNSFFSGDIVIEKAGKVRMLHNYARQPYNVVIYNGINETETDFGTINVVESFSGNHVFTLTKGQTVIFDFGQNLVGFAKIDFRSSKGAEMRLRYAEMLNDDGSKDRGNDGPSGSLYLANLRTAKATSLYYCKGEGIESYCPVMTYFGFRYCEVSANEDIEIESIEAIPISSIFDEMSYIKTNDASLNQLFSNIQWGQLGNFVSVPTDCPQRNERWGWTGDTQVFSRTGMYNTNSEAFYRKFLSDLRDCQREDGAFPDVAPYTKGRGYGRAGWGDAGIIIPWNIYLMYGNKEVLLEHYGAMEKYMNWLSGNHDEGIFHAGPDINYGDWLAYDECDKRYLSVAYYANDALLMSKMSAVLSEEPDDYYDKKVKEYLSLYEDIKVEFNEKYWNPEPDNTAQTTYLVALAFDLLDGEKKELAISNLQQAIERNNGLLSTGFLGTSILLPTLSKVGLNDEAYKLLLQRGNPSWLYCIDQGATTIWERWDSYTLEKGFGPASMNSFNHYSYGAVGEWYYRYMSGIEADSTRPGFKHIVLKPQFDTREETGATPKIDNVESCCYSNYGAIKSSYIINEDRTYEYTCDIPANTNATLYLPTIEKKMKVTISGPAVYVGDSDCYTTFELSSGIYIFKIEDTSSTLVNLIKNDEGIHYDSSKGELRMDNIDDVNEWQVFDLKGQLKNYQKNVKTIDLRHTHRGAYVIKVTSNNVSLYVKVIKN